MKFPFPRRRSPELTILFLTPQRLVRADITPASPSTVQHLWQTPATPGEALPVLAETALQLGPTPTGPVFVISSFVATQGLSVPTPKIGGLLGENLDQALSFEAEALSGLNPFESTLSAVPLGESGGQRHFWITQMVSQDLQQLDEVLLQRRITLAGVVHAGGLPRPMASRCPGESWQRLEVWNDTIFCLDTPANAERRLQLIPAAPDRDHWQPEADAWFHKRGTTGHRETLVADPAWLRIAGSEGPSLSEESVLRTFLAGWALELSQPQARVPIIRPAPRPMAASTRGSISGGLLLATCLLCLMHWFWLARQIRSLEQQGHEAQQPSRQWQALRTETGELEKQLSLRETEIVRTRELLEDWTHGVAREHRRHATLLGSLMLHAPASLMITSVTEQANHLRITGVSMTSESPGFGTGLATAMEPFFWHLEPPRRLALGWMNNGGPWQLEWSLRPQARPTVESKYSAISLPLTATQP